MNIALWIVQVLLAAMFLMAGFTKLTSPVEKLSATMPWVNDVPSLLVPFIGICEVAGAFGLILPSALKIKPKLTVAAAIGLGLTMVLAFAFHASRGEYQGLPVTGFLTSLALFVVWGRSRKAVILSK